MILNEQSNVVTRVNDQLVGLVGEPRTCLLDSKMRFTVSTEWQDILGVPIKNSNGEKDSKREFEPVYVMPDLELKCLNLLSPEEMAKRQAKLRNMDWMAEGVGHKLRRASVNAEKLTLDVQRRVRVGDRFLRFAGITDKVTLAPAWTCVQLWSPDLYPEEADVNQSELAQVYRSA